MKDQVQMELNQFGLQLVHFTEHFKLKVSIWNTWAALVNSVIFLMADVMGPYRFGGYILCFNMCLHNA